MNKRTKIVATLGPATDSPEVLFQIIDAGVDLVRINFSHGTIAEHQKRIEMVRECAAAQKKNIGVLADLQGPKIRVARFADGQALLTEGQTFNIDLNCDINLGNAQHVNVDFPDLVAQVSVGQTLCLDDGKIVLEVVDKTASYLVTIVKVGGVLKDHKGINLVGGGLAAGAITDKDRQDLIAACAFGVEYIALSFVKSVDDIALARKLAHDAGSDAHIIAKIERVEAVADIDAIIKVSDGIMVARGDLAVEVGDAEVPAIQKQLITQCKLLAKPVIVATQMLESMIHQPAPTRAEISDVANAVLDGADAVMLSAESAAGDFPVQAVQAMVRACVSVEAHQPRDQAKLMKKHSARVDEAVAMATIYTANRLPIKAIVALTESGRTALWMSSMRTSIPIFALSRHAKTLGRLTLYRGVKPIYFDVMQVTHAQVNAAVIKTLESLNVVAPGDFVIITKGDYMGVGGGANAMKIVEVGAVV